MENKTIDVRPIWMMLTEIFTIASVVIGMGAYLSHDIRVQSQRTDKLYEMFIDLLKDQKK